MKCSHCGSLNPDADMLCDDCGAPLAPPEILAPPESLGPPAKKPHLPNIYSRGRKVPPIPVTLLLAFALLGLGVYTSSRASPDAASFGEGTMIVGIDISAGTYRRKGTGTCYWERLGGSGARPGDIIANRIVSGPALVAIAPSDKAFSSSQCGLWIQDLAPITSSPTAPFGEGTFMVNQDISPGTWQSAGGGSCRWERLSGFGGRQSEVIADGIGEGQTMVTISASDAGFSSSRCGIWTKTD